MTSLSQNSSKLNVYTDVCATWKTIYHSALTHTHTIHAGAAMWIRIGAVALCFSGPGKRRRPVEEGCVFTGQDKAVVVPGDRGLRERGSARWRFSHTEKDRERGRENESGRVGERAERENTSWRFILPLCNHQWHSPPDPLLSQTNKRPHIPV